MDLNSTLFFKGKFTIENIHDEENDLLWMVICKIKRWMITKWKTRNEPISSQSSVWTKWKLGSYFASENDIVKFKSKFFRSEEDLCFWAGKIIESQVSQNRYAPREWVTEIGFQQIDKLTADISIVIYYSDRPGYIGLCEPIPQSSTPRLIRMLIDEKRICCKVGAYPVSLNPIQLRPGDFLDFFGKVCDENRDISIVYLSPRLCEQENNTVCTLIDPNVLAKNLGPNAIVYYANDLDFSREMTELCNPDKLGCYSGAIRIYAPHPRMSDRDDVYRHRLIAVNDIIDYESEIQDMLRRALAQDVHFYERMFRIEDCQKMIQKQTIERHMKRYKEEVENIVLEEADRQSIDFQKKCDQLEEERFSWEIDKEKYERQVEELQGDLRKAQAYADSLSEEASLSTERKKCLEAIRKIASYPQTASEVGDYFEAHFGDRLVFTERGKKTLYECTTDLNVLWDALYQMATLLYDLYEDGNISAVDREFNQKSPFQIARGEGRMTRKDSKLMRQYRDTYDGQTIDIETHLKSSQTKESSAQFLRIYYMFDRGRHKIIIGSCGKHLDNYSTQKIK